MVDYQMPPVKIGEIVYFFNSELDWKKFNDGNRDIQPIAAVVTWIGNRTLNMVCFPANDSTGFMSKSGVRHASDPDKPQVEGTRNALYGPRGVWDNKKSSLTELEEIVTQLQKDVEALSEAVYAKARKSSKREVAV